MKIAFWSIDNEKCNVTANLAAISVASVSRYPFSVVTIENHLNRSNLGMAYQGFVKSVLFNEVGTNYYDGGGIEGFLRKIYRGDVNSQNFNAYFREVIQKRLYYIPQSRIIHSDLFDYEFSHCLQTMLGIIEKKSDICFIDTASNNNLSTKTILDTSDLIVVNLCQDLKILDTFFSNYSSLIPKSIFIISDYNMHSNLRYKKIAEVYQISQDDIIPIPSNLGYQLAYNDGSVVAFIRNYYNCPNESPNYTFIRSIRKAALIIIRKAIMLAKEKDNHLETTIN